MSESLKIIKRNHYPVRVKLSAVRDRLINELDYEELRRDFPRLGVYKLWRMLNDNGLPVGRDWLFRLLHRHALLVKMKKYRVVTTDSRTWRHQNLSFWMNTNESERHI